MKITAIIPAHNEEKVIAQTITNLRAANPDSILVIADGCTDSTVEAAEASGAMVFQCSEGSKGGALKWLFNKDLTGFENLSGLIAIFDADSTVSPNFFPEVRRAFEGGAQVTQGFVSPVIQPHPSQRDSLPIFASSESKDKTTWRTWGGLGWGKNPAPTLAAYSEVLSQVFDDEVRSRLGWSVPLRGTGMAFRVELLRELLPHIHTRTEDIELSLLLAQRGVRVKFLRDAIIYDPKPQDAERVARQRARWLQGQMQVWRDYWQTILRLSLRGAEMGWLLGALLLKPKTFLVALKLLMCLLVWLLPFSALLKSPFTLLFIAEVLYYIGGLLLVSAQDRSRYAHVLFLAPLYVWVWGRSVFIAWHDRKGRLSARHQ